MNPTLQSRILPIAAALAAASLTGIAHAQQQVLAQEQVEAAGTTMAISPAAVRQVKQALANRGYAPGPISGNWNAQVSQALANFQQAVGLEPTGQLNARTLAALNINFGTLAGGGGQWTGQQYGQAQGIGQGQQYGQFQQQPQQFGQQQPGQFQQQQPYGQQLGQMQQPQQFAQQPQQQGAASVGATAAPRLRAGQPPYGQPGGQQQYGAQLGGGQPGIGGEQVIKNEVAQ